MNDQEVAVLLGELLEQNAPIRFDLPVPLDDVASVSIRTTLDSKIFLRFTFSDSTPRGVENFFECTTEDPALLNEPTATTVLTRPWLSGDFFLQLMFGEYAPKYVLTRCAPADPVTGVMSSSNVIGTVVSELEVAFLGGAAATFGYLDPAVILRVFALFGAPCEELLYFAIEQDPIGGFGLERFFAHHDALPDSSPVKMLCKEALRLELEGRMALGIPTDLAGFRTRLDLPSGPTTTRADVVLNFHAAVESDPDKFAEFHISDLNLHFAAFRAAHYQMELIDIRSPDGWFSHLVLNNPYKVVVNGPVFDLGLCGKQADVFRGAMYLLVIATSSGVVIPGLTKGRLVFRGRPDEMGHCPIPNDPSAWRYYFAQSTTGEYRLHRDFIPANHGFASAVEPAIGVFRDGLRIGAGHEVDTVGSDGQPRGEPDSVYAGRPRTAGIPIVGTCRRMQVDYVFVLIRPDYWRSRPTMASWEDMISFLRDVGVVDAFVTDGDDSVGLIVDNALVFQPGTKKDVPMPLAIGFRRV